MQYLEGRKFCDTSGYFNYFFLDRMGERKKSVRFSKSKNEEEDDTEDEEEDEKNETDVDETEDEEADKDLFSSKDVEAKEMMY